MDLGARYLELLSQVVHFLQQGHILLCVGGGGGGKSELTTKFTYIDPEYVTMHDLSMQHVGLPWMYTDVL